MSNFADQVLILGMKQKKTNLPSKKSPLQKKFFLCHLCNIPDLIIVEVFAKHIDEPIRMEFAKQTQDGIKINCSLKLTKSKQKDFLNFYSCGKCGSSLMDMTPHKNIFDDMFFMYCKKTISNVEE